MTITLEIPTSQEKELVKIASQRGQNPKAFLLSLLDEAILFGDMEPIPADDPEEYAAAVAGIQRGLDDFAAGRHRPAEQVFKDMKARQEIPGWTVRSSRAGTAVGLKSSALGRSA